MVSSSPIFDKKSLHGRRTIEEYILNRKNYTIAIEAQQKIGWDAQLLFGRLSTIWGNIISIHLARQLVQINL